MKTVRCFLAVNLELKTAKTIAKMQQGLIADATDFMSLFKWIPPQNMHVTVRFLGNITEPMIFAIKDNLEPVTKASTPFVIETGDFATFGDETPKILYSKIKDTNGEFRPFVSRVHEVLVNTGFKEIDNTYTPHVILARLKDAVVEEINQLIEKGEDVNCGESLVRDLVCYRSDISKSGVDYQLLWKLPLLKRMPIKEAVTHTTEKNLKEGPSEAAAPTEAAPQSQSTDETELQSSNNEVDELDDVDDVDDVNQGDKEQ